MTGFLDHLAGLALGAKPANAARLSLPPRFTQRSAAIGPGRQGLESIEEVGQSTPAWTTATLPTDGSRDRRASDGEMARVEKPVAFMDRWDERQPEKTVAQVLSHPLAARARETRSAMESAVRPLPSRTLADPAKTVRSPTGVSPLVINTSDARPRPDPQATPVLTSPPFSSNPPPSRTVTSAAPLSQAIVTGRTIAAREERPVIHVTIDRIEVRAPAPHKPAAEQRRPRSQPTVSLSDYLRDGARGGRG